MDQIQVLVEEKIVRLRLDYAEVVAPATAAGLGPGLESLALALSLEDRIHLRATIGSTRVEVSGPGAATDLRDERHPTIVALRAALEQVGAPQVGIELRIETSIPRGRGFGERTTNILLGLGAARALVGDPNVLGASQVERLAGELGADLSRLPAILHGGASLSVSEGQAIFLRTPPLIEPVVFIPDFSAGPGASMPNTVPLAGAILNSSRTALLSLLLAGVEVAESTEAFFDLLQSATEDVLYQRYREASSPASLALMGWLRQKRLPATLCGAGPTVLSLVEVPEAVKDAARRSGWEVVSLAVPTQGLMIINGELAGNLL